MEYASIVLQNEYRQTAWTSPSYNGNMSFLPYPPPPEPGWYDDDVTVMAQPTAEPVDNAADSLETRERLAAQNESDDHDMQDVSVAKGDAAISDEDDIDWDGTVLSEAFTMKQPKHTYVLDNEQTGQQVIVDMGVLLGRKPSAEVPAGAKSVKLEDPTRTISRNHAAISFDQDGTLWIEDYGSLNGTYIIQDDRNQSGTQADAAGGAMHGAYRRPVLPIPQTVRAFVSEDTITLTDCVDDLC